MKKIESTQNKTIKERSKLLLKKERDKSSLFIIEGKHMVEEAYNSGHLKELYLLDEKDNFTKIEPCICTQTVLNKLSSQNSDAQMIGICRKPAIQPNKFDVILLLDSVQDPGNVGTIIRTAHSLGVDYIYLSKDCADLYNPKTIQASQGAIFHIGASTVDLVDTIKFLQMEDTTIYATSLHEPYKNLQDIQPKIPYGIIVGNEGKGIKEELLNLADTSIKIEMDTFESFNVGIATGITLYTLKHKI